MLPKKIISASRGKKIWHKIQKKYHMENEFLILLRDTEKELAKSALSYLQEFIKKKYSSGAVVVTTNKDFITEYSNLQCNINFELVSPEQEEFLVAYYCLYHFYDAVIVVSLNEPFGSYGLLEKETITLDDMVREYIFI